MKRDLKEKNKKLLLLLLLNNYSTL